MLKFSKKRSVLSALVATTIIMPVAVFGVNQLTSINNTYALTYTIPTGYTTIVDPIFYDCVAKEFVKEFPSEEMPATGLTDEQLSEIKRLSCNNIGNTDKITNVKGLEIMTSLITLNLSYNSITEIDASQNTALQSISISDNSPLVSVNVANIPTLKTLDISDYGTVLSSVNVSGCPNLTTLDVSNLHHNESLTELDLRDNVNLRTLIAYGNNLSNKDIVANNTKLKTLYFGYDHSNSSQIGNNFSEINLSNNTLLESLYLTNNQLNQLDVSNLTNLKTLAVAGNNLTTLNLSNNPKLEYLVLGSMYTCSNLGDLGPYKACERTTGNMVSVIDLLHNPLLKKLKLANNNLNSLDLSAQTALEYLDLGNNNLESLDLTNQNLLTYVNIGNKPGKGNNNLNENSFILPLNSIVETLWIKGNSFTKVPEQAKSSVRYMELTNNNFEGSFATKSLPNIRGLYIDDNNLTNLDISGSSNLTGLSAMGCGLTEFNPHGINLKTLNLNGNSIFDFSPIKDMEIGGEYPIDWESQGWGEVHLYWQELSVKTQSKTYILPPLFSQVRDESFGSNFKTRQNIPNPIYTESDFTLTNATLSANGKSITINDLTKPAKIKINGGATDASTLTVTYVDPESTPETEPMPEPEPEPTPEPEPMPEPKPTQNTSTSDNVINVPNTGTPTNDFNIMITSIELGGIALSVILATKLKLRKKISFKNNKR